MVEHFNNAHLNMSELKKSLLEGLQLIKQQEIGGHPDILVMAPLYENQNSATVDSTKFRSEIVTKNKL